MDVVAKVTGRPASSFSGGDYPIRNHFVNLAIWSQTKLLSCAAEKGKSRLTLVFRRENMTIAFLKKAVLLLALWFWLADSSAFPASPGPDLLRAKKDAE